MSSSADSAVVPVMSFNILVKEAMANMPDTFNTKKEIDEYYKKAMKEVNDKLKEEKKANKVGKAPRKALGVKPEPKKRVKKEKELDENGNEIVKVKKPLNNYQKFIQEQRPKVKEEYPELSGEEIFTKIAELWKIHKENMKSDTEDDKKSDTEDIVVVEDKKEKAEKKEKKEKPDKKEKKEKTDAKKESS